MATCYFMGLKGWASNSSNMGAAICVRESCRHIRLILVSSDVFMEGPNGVRVTGVGAVVTYQELPLGGA